jgi:hypothetical protein
MRFAYGLAPFRMTLGVDGCQWDAIILYLKEKINAYAAQTRCGSKTLGGGVVVLSLEKL